MKLGSKKTNPRTITRKFQLWTYGVWGNARDGFDVNDRFKQGEVDIVCQREVFNAGTPHEFETYNPTDRQLSRASGFRGVAWDGEPGETDPRLGWYPAHYTAEVSRNRRPVGELIEVQPEGDQGRASEQGEVAK